MCVFILENNIITNNFVCKNTFNNLLFAHQTYLLLNCARWKFFFSVVFFYTTNNISRFFFVHSIYMEKYDCCWFAVDGIVYM